MDPVKKILWTLHAFEDLKGFIEWIQSENPRSAQTWAGQLLERIEKLAAYPQLGRSIPELEASRYREIIFGDYRMIYEIQGKTIGIIRILHSKQLLEAVS